MRTAVLLLFAAVALCGSGAVSEIRCEGEYPFHLQGAATDGRCIFWSFTTVLVKTDMKGRFLAKHEIRRADGHLGDLCCREGRVYVGVNRGERDGVRPGDEVWVYDAETLELMKKHPTPEAVWCNNGLEWYGGSFWVITNAPRLSRYNYIFEYTPDFRFKRCRVIDSGWTNLGVQTICLHAGRLYFGCYGAPADKAQPHPHVTFTVDPKALAAPTKSPDYPQIVPCERRIPSFAAEGLLVIDGRLMVAQGIRLSPPEAAANQRWTAKIVPFPE